MTGTRLQEARRRAGWTQARLARRLGVTQDYVSLLEGGRRPVPQRLARAIARLLDLPPTALPWVGSGVDAKGCTNPHLADGLVRLGYPGLAYLRRSGRTENPAALLLSALASDNLEARIAEALGWLLLAFEGLELGALIARAKASDLQNRLGFTVALAREVAERNLRRVVRINRDSEDGVRYPGPSSTCSRSGSRSGSASGIPTASSATTACSPDA